MTSLLLGLYYIFRWITMGSVRVAWFHVYCFFSASHGRMRVECMLSKSDPSELRVVVIHEKKTS